MPLIQFPHCFCILLPQLKLHTVLESSLTCQHIFRSCSALSSTKADSTWPLSATKLCMGQTIPVRSALLPIFRPYKHCSLIRPASYPGRRASPPNEIPRSVQTGRIIFAFRPSERGDPIHPSLTATHLSYPLSPPFSQSRLLPPSPTRPTFCHPRFHLTQRADVPSA